MNKQRLLLRFVLTLIFFCTNVGLYAYDFESDGIYYNLNHNEKTAAVTSKGNNEKYTGIIVIPKNISYNGVIYSVTSIGYQAFRYCSGLTSITIPNSVSSIGDYAFMNCSGLTAVTIPNSVTSIGADAFHSCTGLTSVTIPNSVSSIRWGAFSGCSGLISITVSNGNTKYDSRNNCNAIIETSSNTLITGCKNTIIPNSVTIIGDHAFDGCSDLTSITIPNSVTSIGNIAFHYCTGLTSITIPNSVTSIGDNAFADCTGLSYVISEIQNPFKISYSVFDGISTYAILHVPQGTKSRYNYFGWATNFKEIIEDSNSTSYTLSISVSGPGSVSYNNTQIKEGTSSFPIEEGSTASLSINPDEGFRLISVLVNGIDVTSVVYNNMYTTNLITDNVSIDVQFGSWPIKMVIDNIAYNLEEISKTAEVTYKSAGHNDYSGDIVIPETVSYNNITYNVISIGPSAFDHCNTLLSVDIPESIVSIWYRAFSWCESLASVSLPKNIKRLGDEVFYRCTSLSTVISNIETPFSIYESTFRNISTNAKLYVPKGSKSKYAQYENWTKYFQEILENGDTPSITTYSLSITASGNGSASYNSTSFRNSTLSFTVNEGASATVSFTPDNGYQIASVKVNGTDVTSSVSNNKYTINNITQNTTLKVTFEAIPVTTYTLSIMASGNGSATYNSTTIKNKTQSFTVNKGTNVTVTFTPDSEYLVARVKVNNTDVTSNVSNNQYVISNIIQDTSLEVEFEKESSDYDITQHISAYSIGGSVTQTNDLINSGSQLNWTFCNDSEYSVTFKSMQLIDGKTGVEGNVMNVDKMVEAGTSVSYSTTIGASGIHIPVTCRFRYVFNGNEYYTDAVYSGNSDSFTLSIKSTGNGEVTYDGKTIRNSSETFSVRMMSSPTLSFTPDNGCCVKSLLVNNKDVTSGISNNRYTIGMIMSNTSVEVVFEEIMDALTVDGVNYSVTSQNNRTVTVVGGTYGQVLTVPETVVWKGSTWTVIGIDNDALKNSKELAAVIWNPAAAFTATVSNPNLLLYVNKEEYAPLSVQNVVVNGTASNVVLKEATSGNNFYCPQSFVAQKISFTHNYQMQTGIGESRGWETIALPFDVQSITHQTAGAIKPFAKWKSGDSEKPFWLFELTGTGWNEADGIKAYTPYILSMPNNSQYDTQWILKGNVTFAASNVTVGKTENVSMPSYRERTFVPCYANQEASTDIYALNVKNDYVTNSSNMAEGSWFVQNLRQVHPFEAYMTSSSQAQEFFGVLETSIETIDSSQETINRFYDLQGRMVQGSKLPKGIYIMNGKKMLIK